MTFEQKLEEALNEAERLPWRIAGSLESIDPELLKQPAKGRALDDLKKSWLPVPEVPNVSAHTGEVTMSAEEKKQRKEELAKQYPEAAETWTTNEVLRALMPSIIHLAKKYATKRFPLEDAVQQGLIGAMNAIKWDQGMSPFASYAWKPIQTSIRRASFESGVIKVPEGQYDPEKGKESEGGLFGKEQFMGQEIGGEEGEPTTVGAVLPTSARSREIVRGGKLKPGEPKVVTTSTEVPSGQEMSRILHNKDLLQKVFKYAGLTDLEHQAVNLMFGLDDGIERQGKEVAQALGINPRRFSEVKASAMGKLVNAGKTVRAMSKYNVPEQKELSTVAVLFEELAKKLQTIVD